MAVGSIVDYLKSQGKDSSYAARKKLAMESGIADYSGTAAQNTALLSNLQSGSSTANAVSNEGASGVGKPATHVPGNVSAGTSAGTATAGGQTGTAFTKSQQTSDYYDQLKGLEANKPDDYTENDRVSDYYDRLQDKENDKPGAYESQYKEQIDSILDSILNNKEFSYTANDLANDDLYQMYKDNYMRQGNMAMRDVMGNAAGLTGGYGSTYASAAGQQAYDNYLSGLNDKALEFSDRAYQQYTDDRADRYNQMSVVTGLDNTDYGRYRDTVGDYYQDLSYLANRYDTERNFDYGQYRDTVGDYYNDLNYTSGRYDSEYGKDFSQYQQDVQNQQWAQEYAFQQSQAAQEQANWDAQMAFNREQYEYQKAQAAAKAASGGSGRTSSGSKSGTTSSFKDKASGAKKSTGNDLKGEVVNLLSDSDKTISISEALNRNASLGNSLAYGLKSGAISNYDAYETVMQEMEKGNLTIDEAHETILAAGIDETAAWEEEKKQKNTGLNTLGTRW